MSVEIDGFGAAYWNHFNYFVRSDFTSAVVIGEDDFEISELPLQ